MRLKDIGAKNDMPKGWVSSSALNKRIYNMWYHMLYRCYDEDFKESNPTYDECTCHSDFLLLSNFVKWVECEENYTLMVNSNTPYEWTVDKDILFEGNKCYEPSKVKLVTKSSNSKERINRVGSPVTLNNYLNAKPVLGVNTITKEIIYFNSGKDTKNFNFIPQNVTHCCKGDRKTHKGYRWFYITDLLSVMNYLYNEVI